jgi:nicotinate-nucleotide pyrophosphorylase (carboxylating)
VTTEATVDPGQSAEGVILAKSPCVVAGLEIAYEAFRQIDPAVTIREHRGDGTWCEPGVVVARLHGSARALLTAERTALNFLQRLSGIATLTRAFVDAAAGRIVVLDTRKTTPLLRVLEKYAVRAGGGANHRTRLDEAVLIKDVDEALEARAEVVLLDNLSTPEIAEAVRRCRGRARTEISGGVTLPRIPELAATGADYVSVGALTHSAPAADLSFELESD